MCTHSRCLLCALIFCLGLWYGLLNMKASFPQASAFLSKTTEAESLAVHVKELKIELARQRLKASKDLLKLEAAQANATELARELAKSVRGIYADVPVISMHAPFRNYTNFSRHVGSIYITGNLRTYEKTLSTYKKSVLAQFSEYAKVCVHTSPLFDHGTPSWHHPEGEVVKEKPEAVRQAVITAYQPQVMLMPDVAESNLHMRAPELLQISKREQSSFSQIFQLRQLHRACTSGGALSPLVIKTRPDVLVEAEGMRAAVDSVYDWLQKEDSKQTRLVISACLQYDKPWGSDVYDLAFVTTHEVLDLFSDFGFDPKLWSPKHPWPVQEVRLLEFLKSHGVQIIPMRGVRARILRANGLETNQAELGC